MTDKIPAMTAMTSDAADARPISSLVNAALKANIVGVKLLSTVVEMLCRIVGSVKSWSVPIIDKTPDKISALRTAGTLIRSAMDHSPAPSMRAASYRSGEIALSEE